MAQVIIRNLDESTLQSLKIRAAAHGRSLEQELRLVLAAAAQPTREEVRVSAATIRGLGRFADEIDLDLLIREDRER